MTQDVVKVIFRVDSDGDVFALMPDIPADYSGHCTVYQHIGQHGAADYYHCVRTSKPASVEQYSPLAEELRRIGYQLQIRARR